MLNRVIHWFELEPVGALLSYDHDAMWPFVQAGALTDPKRTRYAECRVCKARESIQVYTWGEHLVRCKRCAGEVEFGLEFTSVSPRPAWLADSLARQIDGSTEPANELIAGRLWRLTRRLSSSPSVYLLRSSLSLDPSPIIDALNDDCENGRRLVISTSLFRSMPVAAPTLTFLPLDEVAHMEMEGIRLDTRNLLPHLTDQIPLWFELSPPHNRLTIGSETLSLRRRQPEFMRLLKLAHASGAKTASWRALLQRAGYNATYTSLAQVFPSSVFRFIDTSKDDVWIRKSVLPLSRAGPDRQKQSNR
ncbi:MULTISPECIES: hypothetical protein [unclassified Lysobacter]|uniref:hypothetical protein n=1 Tax=unclassified Lysobacter TaxID=2635362 RepID=UPI001BE9E711|nr:MULTISPECIES: hypothetical protein [unclassified Lysobacter]MBT2746200.1 hypothetical protein [Lysobacter sp. ISL-42]MBT2750745.1 hypothetical protein [Lysobacter sp. ISL-50]MBT2776108.1 hypothetical protein [Lysobacter sp. ISL-54]MBT2784614.1 hypothetical protein [Lysobacter sp. ISL-52]